MNKRIQQLAEQASLHARADNSSMLFENFQKRYTEKFAELIVWECISLLTLTEESALKMNLSEHMLKLVNGIGNQYANGIKEHFFGVE